MKTVVIVEENGTSGNQEAFMLQVVAQNTESIKPYQSTKQSTCYERRKIEYSQAK